MNVCIECQHCLLVEKPEKGMDRHQCRHPELVNPVTGDAVNCSAMRRGLTVRSGRCGLEGRLFVQDVS